MNLLRFSAIWTFAALALVSCRSTPPPAPPEEPAAVSMSRYDIGSILHVNDQLGYVIVRCVILPSDQEELKVVRDDREVARVRVAGPRRPPYLSADVLSGTPRKGDRVRLEIKPGSK